MTLLQLTYFMAICENGSTAKAAEALHVSQSTISLSLKDLEQEFHSTFFTRTNKGLLLTENGRRFHEHAKKIMDAVSECELDMRKFVFANHTLTLSLSKTVGATIWPQLFSLVQKSLPELTLKTFSSTKKDAFQMLEEGKIDAAITALISSFTLPQHFTAINLGLAPRMAMCINASHPLLQQNASIDFQKLCSLPLVRLEAAANNHIVHFYRQYGYEPNYIAVCDQISTMINMISQNLAVGFLNIDAVANYPSILTIPIDDFEDANYFLIYSNKRKMSPALDAFIKAITF